MYIPRNRRTYTGLVNSHITGNLNKTDMNFYECVLQMCHWTQKNAPEFCTCFLISQIYNRMSGASKDSKNVLVPGNPI